jgi:hypothetical protein
VPSVAGRRSHAGIDSGASVQPVGQAAVLSVVASKSHVGVYAGDHTQLVPEQSADSHVDWSVYVVSEQTAAT